MYAGFHEEGDNCPDPKCGGTFIYTKAGDCSCHISPPCSACTNSFLECEKCGFTPEEPEYVDVPAVPGLSIREYKPKPLDPTKISFRAKAHSSSSMIKEGIYPKGTTQEQVREKVNGTFGGRFESFGGGKFRFIAYTD